MNTLEIKNFRKKYNLTQKELSEVVGSSVRAVQSWEQGNRNITQSAIKLLQEYEKSMLKQPVIVMNELEQEVFVNKNGAKFYLFEDDSIKIEVPLLPFEAYCSSDIECYFDEAYTRQEFTKVQFSVDKIGKGVYMGFKTKNDSMNGGGIYDTPNGAEVLGREIGKHLWKSIHKNDYGFILMTKTAILHKDITHYNKESGMFTLHSRNPEFEDFEMCINDVFNIFNVIKRTF